MKGIKQVKNYTEWEMRNFPGGPVWDKYKINNKEMLFTTPLGECTRDEI